MIKTFSLEQISKTGSSLVSNLLLRQYKFDLMARFMAIKPLNPKLTQKKKTKEHGYSISSLQRYRQDINMLSPYRFSPNSNKRKQKISNREPDPKRPQIISNDLEKSFSQTVTPKKNKLKGGVIIEIYDKYLDESLHINNF